MRLDRYLSHASGLSRREAHRLIRAGEVQVDGQIVLDPGTKVADGAVVHIGGEALAAPGPRYFMLHKPAGCVCAARDREHPTVIDLLDVPHPERLHIAGRLDLDATGLVLITDDGEWSHRVTAPRHEFPKTYRVELAEPLVAAAEAQLARGVFLKNEKRRCQPARLEHIAGNEWRITIAEGKYHQVKRMFAAVGNAVIALHRERIGPVALDPALAPGEVRDLTAAEIEAFRSRPLA